MDATRRFYPRQSGNYGSVMRVNQLRLLSWSKPGYTRRRGWCYSNVLHQIRGKFSTKTLIVSRREFTFADACVDDSAETDMEYQYWSFMMSHPAHAPLPSGSVSEAIDVLTWSYTGPFTSLMLFCLSFPRVRPPSTVVPPVHTPIQPRRMSRTFNVASFF